MYKGIILLGILVVLLLTGCNGQQGKESQSISPAAVEVQRDRIQGEPLVGKKFTYVERERYFGEGFYIGNKDELSMLIYEANENYALLAYCEKDLYPFIVRAEKNQRGEYEFSLAPTRKYEEWEEIYHCAQTEKEKGVYDVHFRIQEGDVLVNIKSSENGIVSQYHSPCGIFKLKRKGEKEKVEVCELTRCLGNCREVYKSVYTQDLRCIEVGKARGSDRVSYVEVDFENVLNVTERGEKEIRMHEIQFYQLGDISFFSSPADCDRYFGEPLTKTDSARVYAYEKGYVIEIIFDGNNVKRMGIYQGSREEAMKEYKEGKFFLRGCRVVKAQECYRKGGKIQLPKDVISIAPYAFSAEDLSKKEIKKTTLEIPEDVYLEPMSFSGFRKMDITFEEGRKNIERYAFCCGSAYSQGKVTLPKSVKELKEHAFDQEGYASIDLILREGVKVLGEYSLRGSVCDLPSTIKVAKKGALIGWCTWSGDIQLPKNLEEIGDCCITITDYEPFVIPASVKKIGRNAFLFEVEMHPRVVVEKGNKHFKMGENDWLYSKDGKKVYLAWDYYGDIEIPKGVEYMMCELNMSYNKNYYDIIYPESYKGNLYAEYLMDTQGEVDFEY